MPPAQPHRCRLFQTSRNIRRQDRPLAVTGHAKEGAARRRYSTEMVEEGAQAADRRAAVPAHCCTRAHDEQTQSARQTFYSLPLSTLKKEEINFASPAQKSFTGEIEY